ncbi:N-acetylmuramidase family protein [Vacuolonema iberomarrocanum]|uniref:N-acetylmuramidase family protein n=1 Tax=Vacuolonema iberomarrocanum TaxID=3454632 RepID=UPI0019DE1EA2|nr:N-acetylmuramidase family protein [filamentous cyanobacterium LEGE 07170]
MKTLTVKQPTVFKKNSTLPSEQIPDTHKLAVSVGTELNVLAWREAGNQHITCTFDGELGRQNWNTWTMFHPHVRIDGVTIVDDTPRSKFLEPGDFERVANKLDISVAAIRAVVAIEAAGSGFLNDGRPKILFEAHHFSRQTGRRYDRSHPRISSRRWNRSLYLGGVREWTRLHQAASLDRDAAWKSASWGLGQVMGFNYPICGFRDIEQFVKAQERSEGDQLDTMFAFIRANRLHHALRRLDWRAFARGYNGAGFAANRYDQKLAAAYRRFK